MKYDVIVIGGGPAGLAAALAAKDAGAEKILIAERDMELGGILNQCIHNGFGLHYFGEELTGPEYAAKFIDRLEGSGIEAALDTMVLEVTPDKHVLTLSAKDGARDLEAEAVVLAMGCRERTRGAVGIPGDRPAGVLTAGTAQRLINMEGWAPGRRAVILGSGDIGLIMARRLTLEGAKVLACIEVMPYSGGLNRNIVQCLHDYDIPLYLSHTISKIEGDGRVEKVTVAKVDENRRPIPGSEFTLECDTVLLSVGLIPENELSRQAGVEIDARTSGPVVSDNMETSIPGIFACGNVVHVHDLADYVTEESMRAGRAAGLRAAQAARGVQEASREPAFLVRAGDGITYTVPQQIGSRDEDVEIFFRVNRILDHGTISVRDARGQIAHFARKHLAPGEMEKIRVPARLLEDAEGHALTVSVEQVKENG